MYRAERPAILGSPTIATARMAVCRRASVLRGVRSGPAARWTTTVPACCALTACVRIRRASAVPSGAARPCGPVRRSAAGVSSACDGSTSIRAFCRCASSESNGCDRVRARRRAPRVGARHCLSVVRITAARRGSAAHRYVRESGRTRRDTRRASRSGANADGRSAASARSRACQGQGVARGAQWPRWRAHRRWVVRRTGAYLSGGLDTAGGPRASAAATKGLVLASGLPQISPRHVYSNWRRREPARDLLDRCSGDGHRASLPGALDIAFPQ